MTTNEIIERVLKLGAVGSLIASVVTWGYSNIATKSDLQRAEQLYLINLLEIRITQAEDSLKYLDDIRDEQGTLTSSQERRYRSKLSLKTRLEVEKDNRLSSK